MRRTAIVTTTLLSLVLTGCSTSRVVGTWNGRGASPESDFTFGSVSFVGDKTFTAESRYSGNVRVQSGTWSTSGHNLKLWADQMERQYTFKVSGDTLTVTDPKSGHSITLDRLTK